ncbi:MAG: MFS transporter [Bryobacteraceae bacterium]
MRREINPWVLVAVLWVVAALNYLDRQVIFSVLPLLRADLNMSNLELGLLGTAFLWVYAVLSPVCGYVADRFGRRRVIGISLLVWSLVTWATGQARTAGQLLALRGAMGVSEAFYLPAALALIADRHGEKTRSLATGIHISGVYAGLILGGAGGWLGQQFGWRWAFGILGAAGVVYMMVLAPVLARTREARPTVEPQFRGSIAELLRTPGYVPMLIVFMTTSVANWMLYTWLPLFLYEHFHMDLARAGFYTIFVHLAGVIGILGGGWVADWWASATPRGRVFTQVTGLLVNAPALFLLGLVDSTAGLILALVAFGIGKGFYDANNMPVLSQIARNDLRATGYGIFNLGGCLAGGLSAPLAGYLKDAVGLETCLRAGAVVVVVSIALLFRVRPKSTLAM